jgi:glycine cleavage system H protein
MKKAKIKYTPKHNWVELKRKVVAIGITDYLTGELGDLIDLCLPKVGEELISGISYGEIESINILHDLIAPLSGEIVKVNSDLATSLKALQKDPYGESWFIKIRLEEADSLDSLMDEDEYEEYIKSIKKKAKEAGKRKKKVEVKKEVEIKAEKKKEKKVVKKVVKKAEKKTVKKKTVAKNKKR